MSPNLLEKALQRSAQLMNDPEFNRLVERKAGTHVAKEKNGGGNDLAALEAQCFAYASGNNTPSAQVQAYQSPIFTNNNVNSNLSAEKIQESNLPQNIKEEYLARLNNNTQTVSMPQNNGGIDYTIIKALIDESISRNLENIKSSIITENSLRAFKIGSGNKIQLLDQKGNLYEAELKLKKKAAIKK